MKKKNKLYSLVYVLFAFAILIFGAMSFFMHKDILLVPTFCAFVGMALMMSIRAKLEGDQKSFLLFGGGAILFVFVVVAMWRHMNLTFDSFLHIF